MTLPSILRHHLYLHIALNFSFTFTFIFTFYIYLCLYPTNRGREKSTITLQPVIVTFIFFLTMYLDLPLSSPLPSHSTSIFVFTLQPCSHHSSCASFIDDGVARPRQFPLRRCQITDSIAAMRSDQNDHKIYIAQFYDDSASRLPMRVRARDWTTALLLPDVRASVREFIQSSYAIGHDNHCDRGL